MLPAILAVTLALAGVASGQSMLNLTPALHKSPIEGGYNPDVAFRNGDELVTYQPPWEISGSHDRAVMKPRVSQAEAVIDARPKSGPGAFDADTVASLKKEMAATLGKDALKVEWAEDEKNVLLLNRHETYRMTVSFTLFSQRFTQTVIFCNFAEQQLRFSLTARESDFKALYDALRRSLYTFQGLA